MRMMFSVKVARSKQAARPRRQLCTHGPNRAPVHRIANNLSQTTGMTKSFTPPDNEFAAASGSNVNFNTGWSYFDNPPNSTRDLTITSNEGDLDPNTFQTGETYDLTWSGNGGGGSMDDAVVIRSDYIAPGQGAIVFEGTNSNTGELFQMVWSPGFDLESWYWDNGGGPSSPNAFYTSDQDTQDFKFVCYAKGTRIDTPRGPRAVEMLQAGDQVCTLDNGAQDVVWVGTYDQPLEDEDVQSKPVHIKAGALGYNNPARDLIVSPQHRILVGGHNQGEDIFRDECFAPAKALTGLRGVRFMSGKKMITWVHFACARHEVAFANGCTSESLLLGPMALKALDRGDLIHLVRTLGGENTFPGGISGQAARSCLTVDQTRRQIARGLKQRETALAQDIENWDDDLAREERETSAIGPNLRIAS